MYKLMLFIVLSICCIPGLAYNRAERIYHELNSITKLPGIKIKITRQTYINASANYKDRYIKVTQGAIDKLDDDELAVIIGHEITHIYLRTSNEALADYGGLSIVKKSRYNGCKGGTEFFKLLLKTNGDQGGPGDPHPRNSDRLKFVKKFSCH